MQTLSWQTMRLLLPTRKADAHKGDSGHLLVIGGAPGFSGAARLAAETALRCGAGLVSVATHPFHAAVMNIGRPELMCHAVQNSEELEPLLQRASFIAIGSGLSQTAWGLELWKAAVASGKPMLVDADGLNLLSQQPFYNPHWILTPHPGEAARLLNTSVQETQQNRFPAIQELISCYGGIAVLKGANTLIANDTQTFINEVANPALATAGTGDVLAGMIASFATQGLSLAEAAKLGVTLHSKSAEVFTTTYGSRGMLASDLWLSLVNLLSTTS